MSRNGKIKKNVPNKNRQRPTRILAVVAEHESLDGAVSKAVRLARALNAEIELLHVHRDGRGLPGGGIDMGVVKTGVKEWGNLSVGQTVLAAGCEALERFGWLAPGWRLDLREGDSFGECSFLCRDSADHEITLWHKAAADVATGVREHCRERRYDGIVLDAVLHVGRPPRRFLPRRRTQAERIVARADVPVVIDRTTRPARKESEPHGVGAVLARMLGTASTA